MSAPAQLQAALHELLGDARLVAETLPDTELRLWLIDAANMDRAFSPEETRRILDEPPYWCFCWASGLVWPAGWPSARTGCAASACWISARVPAWPPSPRQGRSRRVVACDTDPLALAACRANAALNGVELRYSQDFFGEADRFDLILVADVLYDRANLPLLDQFLSRGREALVADSRVRDFAHPLYRRLAVIDACTGRIWQSRRSFAVSLYHATR